MQRILFLVIIGLFGTALASGQTTQQQPEVKPEVQAPPLPPQTPPQPAQPQPSPSEQQAAPQPQQQPQMGNQPAQTQQPAAGDTSRTGGVPWVWVVVGLGVMVLLLVVLLSARGSGGVERFERVESHEHHDIPRHTG